MRLSILSRLILGYLFLFVIAAGMSVYAVVQLGVVTDTTHSIIRVDNGLVNLQKEMTDELLSETRYERKYVILQDRTLFEGFQKSRSDFGRALATAIRLDGGDDAWALLRTITEQHNNYVALFLDEAGQLKSGRSYSRQWYAEEKERSVNSALDALVRLRNLGQQSMLAKVQTLSEAGDRARTFAIGVSAVALLTGLLLAIIITRSITRPLAAMQKKTRDIAEGVFEPDLKLPSPPEIGELAQALNSMSTRLREVDRMKSDFFALMSHELRTPLTSIKEGTNLFLEGRGGEVTERQRRLLTIISEESDRLIGLVNSVLDLAKLESGMVAFNRTKTDLSPLIDRVIGEIRPLAEAKRILIARDLGPLPSLDLDPERMLQALRNLVGNALKFTPQGGTVSISSRLEGKGVVVTVADTGPGIPAGHAAAVFDKFRQAPGAGRVPGSGLGLAIVKHIIQTHGGTVWVESEQGKGSTFSFQLPV
jgi:two-component system sensor histidine kinase GlrK